jgi:hypothetical protein
MISKFFRPSFKKFQEKKNPSEKPAAGEKKEKKCC